MAKSSLLSSLLVVSVMLCAVSAQDLLQTGAFYTFTNVNSGKLLTVLGNSMTPGTKLVQETDHKAHNQMFQAKDCGLPAYCFLNRHSGQAIDVPSGTHTENIQIQQWTENDSTAQQFHVIRQSNGAYKVENIASGLILDVRGAVKDEDAAVIQFHDKNGGNQEWFLTIVNA